MAYSVNWVTKVITIPTSDLTLVSGTRYKLQMADFLAECRRLEWEFTEGLWAPPIVEHTDTRFDFAGANYAPFDEIINGYTVQMTGVATRVDLLGSNNDIIDVLIPTGISVVPANTAGLVVAVSTVTSADVWDEILEGGATARGIMRALMGTGGNTMDMIDNGDGTYTMSFYSMDGQKTRVQWTGPIDGSGRATAQWDMT